MGQTGYKLKANELMDVAKHLKWPSLPKINFLPDFLNPLAGLSFSILQIEQ
jgi:hypothetical protein